MTQTPEIQWPRDFDVSDIMQELDVLDRMIESNMPDEVVRAQRAKVIATQFDGMDDDKASELQNAVQNEASSL